MNYEEITKDSYTKVSKDWNSKRQFSWKPVIEFLSSFENKKDLKILDVGCGAGRDLDEAFKQGFLKKNCYGVDYSKGQIEITKEKGYNGSVTSMIDLPYENESFDLMTSIAAHHHLLEKEDQLKALVEMKRVLKGSGFFLLVNWYPEQEYFENEIKKGKFEKVKNKIYKVTFDKKVDRYYYFFEKDELEKLCIEAGFKIEKSFIEGSNIYLKLRK